VQIEVQLFATLARFLPGGARDGTAALDVPDGSTLGDVLRRLAIPSELATVALVNGQEAEAGHRLEAGDVVAVFPPLAGGAGRPMVHS
jgi:molybdopterin converting factor small subunit